jgi:hypothetical protein
MLGTIKKGIDLAGDRDRWRALVNAVVNLRISYEFNNRLNPWCRIILVKKIFPQVLMKLSAFYEIRLFNSLFKTTCHLTLSQGRRFHFTLSQPIALSLVILTL